MPSATFTVATQTRMFALTKTVKIALGSLVFQSAVYLEGLDGDISVTHALPQSFIHGLLVVHLAVAYSVLPTTEPMTTAIGILQKLLGRDKLNAAIYYVATCHLCRVSMLTQ